MRDIDFYKKDMRRVINIAINDLSKNIGDEVLMKSDLESMKKKSGAKPSAKNDWGKVGIVFKNTYKARSAVGETPAKQTGNLVSKTKYIIGKNTLRYIVDTPYALKLEKGHTLKESYDRSKWNPKMRSGNIIEGRPYLSTIVKNSGMTKKRAKFFKEALTNAFKRNGY